MLARDVPRHLGMATLLGERQHRALGAFGPGRQPGPRAQLRLASLIVQFALLQKGLRRLFCTSEVLSALSREDRMQELF